MNGNGLHTKEELDQITNVLQDALKSLYDGKGKDFSFRISYLSRLTGVSSHTITNLRHRLPIQLKHTLGRASTYETVFDGKD